MLMHPLRLLLRSALLLLRSAQLLRRYRISAILLRPRPTPLLLPLPDCSQLR